MHNYDTFAAGSVFTHFKPIGACHHHLYTWFRPLQTLTCISCVCISTLFQMHTVSFTLLIHSIPHGHSYPLAQPPSLNRALSPTAASQQPDTQQPGGSASQQPHTQPSTQSHSSLTHSSLILNHALSPTAAWWVGLTSAWRSGWDWTPEDVISAVTPDWNQPIADDPSRLEGIGVAPLEVAGCPVCTLLCAPCPASH